jgi:hypothetical protein
LRQIVASAGAAHMTAIFLLAALMAPLSLAYNQAMRPKPFLLRAGQTQTRS